MDFKIKSRPHPNIPKYHSDDFDLAKKFAQAMERELGAFLKAAILFGSVARNETPTVSERDIDVLVIINDLTAILSEEVVQSYRVITENLASRVTRRLHITTLKLTTFWEYVRNGDPIALNMLRDGVPLYDSGFFEPVQHLLFEGKIRPSKESVWLYFARAPATLNNAKGQILQATVDLYWAVVDSAHAALMHHGEVPPTPAHLPEMIERKLVRTGLVNHKYADIMNSFYDLHKRITHRQVAEISGKQFDEYRATAEEFVKIMQSVVERRN
ncbi:MAG TPA: nucleotidyltransferase domain-containing protein [Candidatus Nanoarchaeia archaeon]|nr:nucleotidyltransferase domain-containing protein [Candidatus Nanoarchaeia archaeon]